MNVPLPDHEKKLVVNAIFESGEQFDVYLTRSYGPLEEVTPEDILIGDATVEILDAGNVIETLT